jgi:hypothetical protein
MDHQERHAVCLAGRSKSLKKLTVTPPKTSRCATLLRLFMPAPRAVPGRARAPRDAAEEDRRAVGQDLERVQHRWPVGIAWQIGKAMKDKNKMAGADAHQAARSSTGCSIRSRAT